MFVDGAMLAHQNGRFAALRAGRSILALTPPSEPRLFAWGLLVERLDFTDVLNAIQVTCMYVVSCQQWRRQSQLLAVFFRHNS